MRRELHTWRGSLRRLFSAMLALALVWSALPAAAEVTHGMVVVGVGETVNFRPSYDTSDFIDKLPAGWVAKVLSQTTYNGVIWYQVETNGYTLPNRTYTGYIHGNFFRMLSAEEEAAWLVSKPQPYTAAVGNVPPPTATPTPAPSSSSAPTGDHALVTVAGANLRQEPGGISLTALQKDQLVKVLAFPSPDSPWYQVQMDGITGYLQTEHLRVLSPSELAAWLATVAPPEQNPENSTPAPAAGDATGTLEITKTSTNLRREPGGTSIWQYPVGAVLSFYGAPVFTGGFYWAKVTDSQRNLTGYVRSDCYKITSGVQITNPPPSSTPGPSSASVRITLGRTNLRQAPGGTVVAVLDRNRILPFYGSPTSQSGYKWV